MLQTENGSSTRPGRPIVFPLPKISAGGVAMRGMDDRAAANQRAIDALSLARRRAVADCHERLLPGPTFDDATFGDTDLFRVVDAWDELNVTYLRAEWPPSM